MQKHFVLLIANLVVPSIIIKNVYINEYITGKDSSDLFANFCKYIILTMVKSQYYLIFILK